MSSRRAPIVLASAAALAALAAGPAAGAVPYGQVAPNAANTIQCGGPENVWQLRSGGSPNYKFLPFQRGVISSWQHNGKATNPGSGKLITATESASTTITGVSGLQTLLPGVQSYATRVTVKPGSVLGLRASTDIGACYTVSGVPAEQVSFGRNPSPEPSVGSTDTATTTDTGDRLNVAVRIEADADDDGFGDETQDKCPTRRGACDDERPLLRRLRVRSPFMVDPDGQVAQGGTPTGTSIRFRLSEAGVVRFVIERRRRATGRLVRGKCRARTRRNRNRRRCARYRRVGSFSRESKKGSNRVLFSGRLTVRGRTRSLTPGRHRVSARPRDWAGNRGKVKRARFRVVR